MKKLLPPKKIKIVGKTYKVENAAAELVEMCRAGDISASSLEIRYDGNQAHTQLRDTLLHEVIHGVDFSLALGLKERQVHALAAALLMLLDDNPAFAKWLLTR